jgi:two-component system sensor histidine kinase KdpD
LATGHWRPSSEPHSDDDERERSVFGSARAVTLRAGGTLLLVACATLVTFIFTGILGTLNLVTIIFLIPVLMAAIWWGTGPAILAAVAGALSADFFFYPPLYSFWISDTQNIADLIVFLIVALVGGGLAADVRKREREIYDLYGYSRQLATCFTTADLVRATQNYLSRRLGRPTMLIEATNVEDDPSADLALPKAVRRDAVATTSLDDIEPHTITDDATRHTWLVRRVPLGTLEYIVFADLGAGAVDAKRIFNHRVDDALTEATETLARLDLVKAVEEFQLQIQADTLKNALVTTISHDLRNPLVSILGATSVLAQMAPIREDTRARSLVTMVYDEAARLDSNIQNIIAAARITTGVKQAIAELTDPVDIVRAAIEQKRTQLAAHHLDVSLVPGLPLVKVQSALVENAVSQLLENAAKYSPSGSTIKVDGRFDQDWVELSVSDQGIGLTPDERQLVGQRSFRGTRQAAAAAGSGLGLWIASTFITSNGGRLDVTSEGPGLGTTIRVRLPIAREARAH